MIDNDKRQVEVHLKLWQLVLASITVMTIFVTGWININMQVRSLEVQQQNQLKQIELNTKKIETYYKESIDNQFKIMDELYDVKLLIKSNENNKD